jgi:hypothetical protein
MADIDTVRRTLAVVAAERDHAHRLLRAVRLALGSEIPQGLLHKINGAVTLESEGDIQRAHDEAMTLLLGDPPT